MLSAERADPFQAMHVRLLAWGLCWIRAGASNDRLEGYACPSKDDDKRIVMDTYRDPPENNKKPRVWTKPEIEAAGRLHSLVIRLPEVSWRMVLQTFYGETCAEYWHELTPIEKAKIIRDLTTWPSSPPGVNARIDRYNRTCRMDLIHHVDAAKIRPADFEPIMNRAIRHLMARERGMA